MHIGMCLCNFPKNRIDYQRNMNYQLLSEKMTYDQAIERLEKIVTQMEQSDAVAMDEYSKIAREAAKLIVFCQKHLTSLENEINETLTGE